MEERRFGWVGSSGESDRPWWVIELKVSMKIYRIVNVEYKRSDRRVEGIGP